MSHNSNDLGRQKRRHKPALIAIAVAILAAVIAFMVFPIGVREQNEGIATTPPPPGTTSTTAEGRGPDDAAPSGGAETAPATN